MPPKIYFPRVPLQMHRNYLATKGEVVLRTHCNQNKIQIKQYLQDIYGVKVRKVNTANYEGKIKRYLNQKTGKGYLYRRPKFKKAYVTLVDDEALQMARQLVDSAKESEEAEPKRQLSARELREMHILKEEK